MSSGHAHNAVQGHVFTWRWGRPGRASSVKWASVWGDDMIGVGTPSLCPRAEGEVDEYCALGQAGVGEGGEARGAGGGVCGYFWTHQKATTPEV